MPEYHEILQASGEKTKFDTGAQRDQCQDKGRFDLDSPIVRQRMALLLEKGAKHYGERNWEKGIKISHLINSTMRHLTQFQAKMEDEDHACQAAFNIMAAIHTLALIEAGVVSPDVDDRVAVPLLNIPKGVTTYARQPQQASNHTPGSPVEKRPERSEEGLAGSRLGQRGDDCSHEPGGTLICAVCGCDASSSHFDRDGWARCRVTPGHPGNASGPGVAAKTPSR